MVCGILRGLDVRRENKFLAPDILLLYVRSYCCHLSLKLKPFYLVFRIYSR